MKKYQYLASWDDQTLTRVGEPVVVLGDSNVSQVEFIMPSNFELEPTKAEARAYFLLPGEKESDFETLETATKDENGDSHVTWTIKHAHSQRGGRLAFSLALIGDDAQWNSRTAIIPVHESRYQPESEESEEPYTGRLTALEGSMASIRGEFAEVQEDFEELKETATLGTPIPESLTANMAEGHVYIYTGTETGYTAGHVYYYVNGALKDGGVYGGTAVDATLTQSGQAADAKKTGDEISQIKEDLSDLEESVDKTVNASIKELTNSYIDFVPTYKVKEGYYLKQGDAVVYYRPNTVAGSCKITDIIPCEEGYVYSYSGKSSGSLFAYALFNGDVCVSTGAPGNVNNWKLTIPADVDGVMFQSYAAPNETPSLTVDLISPTLLADALGRESETAGKVWTKTATGAEWKPASGSGNLDLLNRINNVIPSEYPYTDIAGGGYYVANGVYKFLSNSNFKCRVTDKIPVFEGMEFIAILNVAAAAFSNIYFFNDDVFVSQKSVYTSAAMYKKVTVPSGVNYMIAQSTASTADESIRWFLKRIYPHDANKDPLRGVKLTIIGDSISIQRGAFKISYFDRLQNTNGMVIQNLAKSGTGFLAEYSGETKYINRIASIDSDTDIILVSGSFNDLNRRAELGTVNDMTESTIAGCMNLFFTELLANYPTKKILITTTNPWSYYHAGVEKSDNYVEMLGKIADKYGIPYYPLYRKTNLRPWNETCNNFYFLDADGTHPNTEGHKELYNLLLPAIRSIVTAHIDNEIAEKARDVQ